MTTSNLALSKYRVFPSLRLYDRLHISYVVLSDMSRGPLWTGDTMLLDANDEWADVAYFHELAHWLVATPAQRRRPDFGLDRQVNADNTVTFTSSATPHLYAGGFRGFKIPSRGWGERCVTRREAARQEELASIALGLYEPLVGCWTWQERPDVNTVNTAFFDFNNVMSPPSGRTLARIAAELHRQVVTPLDARVGADTVADYLTHVVGLLP